MRASVLLILCIPLLSSCEAVFGPDEATRQAEAVQQRLDQLTQDINGCTDKRKSGQLTTHVAYAQCVNVAFQSAMIDVRYPYPDIVATLSAERLRVAELADKGQISDAEGMARINDTIAEIARTERARNLSLARRGEPTPPQYFLQMMQVSL
jgi:hypothetical protein